MRIHAIARHEFETQKRSNTIENPSYNLNSYIFLKVTYKCFGSTRSQVRILSPRLNQNPSHKREFPGPSFLLPTIRNIRLRDYIAIICYTLHNLAPLIVFNQNYLVMKKRYFLYLFWRIVTYTKLHTFHLVIT